METTESGISHHISTITDLSICRKLIFLLPLSLTMELCSIKSTTQLKLTSRCLRINCVNEQSCGDRPRVLMKRNKFDSITMSKLSRRTVIELMGLNSMVLHIGPALSAPMESPQVSRTLKLPSGVQVEEIVEGEGPKAKEGDSVEINYACRRYNGYFVHSTVDQFSGESMPVILPLIDNQIIQGLKEVLIGMRAGGKRRALIPPSAGYVSESLQPIPEEFGPRRSLLSHVNESLVFEVQVLKVL